MIIAIVPVIVMVIGVLAYALSQNGKIAELGRIAFAVGLLWTVYAVLGQHVTLG